ncbi:helix-turn-helix domain-containing protein [Pontibacter sp. SGAir0037]|uniref:helix-turn-helix domain-containing protein n=1 Tax=Pontibacter sp. SGAir0037 TaxID=2571030 RepID=UPI0010CCDC32|nr:helix-turn-helix domain-containing protein [Pontibacter sp. SGAir0037]QCR24760.1 hypothetical protein C1N53_21980 [Pontibacter sp. SGAir0037]
MQLGIIEQMQQQIQHQEELIKELVKRVNRLEKGLSEWVKTGEACKLTGLHRDTLYNLRAADKVAYKFEGKTVLYLRSSLQEYNDTKRPRKVKA